MIGELAKVPTREVEWRPRGCKGPGGLVEGVQGGGRAAKGAGEVTDRAADPPRRR